VAGIFRFVAAFAADELTSGTRALIALLGIISLIPGLYAVRHVLISLLALALLLCIFWIIGGTGELFVGLSRQEMRGRAWTGLMGVLSVLARLIVLISPAISLLHAGGRARYLAARARRPADSPGIPSTVGPPPGTTRSQGARDV
jgi:uncharacterized membrane protein HdeD (DUF308 family)